jgi:hypothetical protein
MEAFQDVVWLAMMGSLGTSIALLLPAISSKSNPSKSNQRENFRFRG